MIERDAEVNGRRLHYRCAGSGPPTLLLHALGESSLSWARVLPALAARRTVIAPDLPGFADSEPATAPPDPAHLADATAAFLAAEQVGPATVVGNSLGGTVALQLALRHPERLSRVSAPTLIVWGADDMVLPPAHAHGAGECLGGGHVQIVPACGHLPQLERPERFVAALDPFLGDDGAGMRQP
jgi:pimeloyl-ACP methyl ester carboxylesterase